MALYPGALPAAGSASPTDNLQAAGHTALHNTAADEARAIAQKLGTGASTPTANKVLVGDGVGTSSWAAINLTTMTDGTLPVNKGGTGGATAAEAATNLTAEIGKLLYPVGSIYINANVSTNPATLLGFGTWTAWGVGRAIVGIDTSQTEFDTAEETGGAKTHTLTSAESGVPAHTHLIRTGDNNYNVGYGGAVDGAGNGMRRNAGSEIIAAISNTPADASTAHNNLQPYQVGYVWKRTA